MKKTRLELRRRALLLGAAASAGGLLLPARARAVVGARRSRALVLGGSAMVGAVGRCIEEDLGAAGFVTLREAKISSGLARPDFFDWPARARALYESHLPDVTVCMFGGNDGQGLHMGKGAEPEWIRWHEPGWSEEYARRVTALAEAVTTHGEHLFWIGMPVMGSDERTERMYRLNQIARHQVGLLPRGYFVDTWELFADTRGGFSTTLRIGGERVTVRARDGVHFTGSGGRLLADHVVPMVRAAFAA